MTFSSAGACSTDAPGRRHRDVPAAILTRIWALALAMVAVLALGTGAQARVADGDPATEAALQQVEDWFSRTRSLKADFVQVDDAGYTASGKLWLRRPGRVRFEYDPPVPLMIVSDGIFVMFVDKELEQVDRLPLVRSPLSILTADEVDLRKDAEVRDVSIQGGLIHVTLADPDSPEEGEVTLVFRGEPMTLRQWIVRDATGKEVAVTLQDTEVNPDLPQRLFVYTDPAPGRSRNLP
ncbi:outer membrane lipoprotein carrier protein LolA [Marinibaculum pumilum]|uniref:Outer membrane lipoprotein carrier protein LolA n=1 Tax=Marinibaculum pumilum TaxID=1766165 RepID=A0ABV7KXY0_9PROT